MSDALLQRLDALVPAEAAHGDWDDVLVRAGVSRAARGRAVARPHRRRLVAIALAVALVVVLAAPALAYLLGWIGRHDVSYSQSKPAPNVVKKQFADLAIGAPPSMRPGVEAAYAREVGRFRVRGKLRALWVAPTRSGGFCFTWEKLWGGCLPRPSDRLRRPLDTGWGGAVKLGEAPRTIMVSGTITGDTAARLELVYRDGKRTSIPFVYVSRPIDAGFFDLWIPESRQAGSGRPKEVVLYDRSGKVMARAAAPSERRPLRPFHNVPRRPRPLPTRAVPPTRPLQTASANGVSVTAGANGSLVFRIGNLDPERRAVLGRVASYTCFKITHEFGIFDAQGAGTEGRVQSVVALHQLGAKTPFDGCQIGGEGGHLWPDHFESHTPVEIPLTAAGRRFFADRAAARDLALFVRTRRVQRLRKESPAQALRDLRAAYPQLAHSRIRIAPTATGLTFTEGRFRVVVSHRRIVSQNLKPYAFVF